MRRRGQAAGKDKEPPAAQKEVPEVTFTTKYIDTLNDLQRLENENKRLMLRMRSLEAQIVPASKNSQDTFVKILAPSCLEYHNEERKLNKALQEENEMLRRQFQNSVNAAAEANEKLIEALNKNKILELSVAGRVDGANTQHSQEVKKLQELQVTLQDLERRWAVEKKQLTMDRDSYALQCESLKADTAAAKERLETSEKERANLQKQLAHFHEGEERSEFAEDENKLDSPASRGSVLAESPDLTHHSIAFDHIQQQSARPPTATRGVPLRAPSPLQSRPPTSPSRPTTSSPSRPTTSSPSRPTTSSPLSRPTSSSRGLPSRGNAADFDARSQLAMRNDISPKLENEVLVLSAKNKELQKTADQSRILAEEMEAQNEALSVEVKRLSDKLRLLTALEGRFFTRPEYPPILPTVRNGPSESGKVTKRASTQELSKSGRISKEKSLSTLPPPTPWDTGPSISGQKILSPKKSMNSSRN